jgi:hypothetical protein
MAAPGAGQFDVTFRDVPTIRARLGRTLPSEIFRIIIFSHGSLSVGDFSIISGWL